MEEAPLSGPENGTGSRKHHALSAMIFDGIRIAL
jgi:hypothetical protein